MKKNLLVTFLGVIAIFLPLTTFADISGGGVPYSVGDRSMLNDFFFTFDEDGSACLGLANYYADYLGEGTPGSEVETNSGSLGAETVTYTGIYANYVADKEDTETYNWLRMYFVSAPTGDFSTDFAAQCDFNPIVSAVHLQAYTYSRSPSDIIYQDDGVEVTVDVPDYSSSNGQWVWLEVGQDSWCTAPVDTDSVSGPYVFPATSMPADNVVGSYGFIRWHSSSSEPPWSSGEECGTSGSVEDNSYRLEGTEINILEGTNPASTTVQFEATSTLEQTQQNFFNLFWSLLAVIWFTVWFLRGRN